MNTAEKTCFKCGAEKPLTEFYKHKRMADGHLNKCKECTKHDVREHRRSEEYGPKVRAYDRQRGCRRSYAHTKQYREKYPLKKQAHHAVNNAVRDGKMAKPSACEQCGSSFWVEGHHDDYAKPLEVRWLCALCHKRWHAEHGEAANAA